MKYKLLYEISFKSEDDWGYYNKNGKYHKGAFTKTGYNQVILPCTDGKHHTFLVHRLKWEYFNGEIPEGMVIDHKIPISEGGTNKLSNLRLVTPKGNVNNPISKKKRINSLTLYEYNSPVMLMHLSKNQSFILTKLLLSK